MDELSNILAGLVGKGGKRRKLTDAEETVLLEIVKCLRVLLNTEVSSLYFIAQFPTQLHSPAWFQLCPFCAHTRHTYRVHASSFLLQITDTRRGGASSNLCAFYYRRT